MNKILKDKKITIGITGSIAAYKILDLIRKLVLDGSYVNAIITESGLKFITPLTVSSLLNGKVYTDKEYFDYEEKLEHIFLARESDVIVVAPATANTIAKIRYGLADNLLTSTILATLSPVIIAPAMNDKMYANKITQENIEFLKNKGFYIIEPEEGLLANISLEGLLNVKPSRGRLAKIEKIYNKICAILYSGPLKNKNILITAGPTHEYIDSVRFISNASSGLTGYLIAKEAAKRGTNITLISGPTNLEVSEEMKLIKVKSAIDMKEAVSREIIKNDILIMAAAVADYKPKEIIPEKLKKKEEEINLILAPTPDILKSIKDSKKKRFFVGFALENEKNMIENGKKKLQEKNLDLIAVNTTAESAGPSMENLKGFFIDKNLNITDFQTISKNEFAIRILDKIEELLNKN